MLGELIVLLVVGGVAVRLAMTHIVAPKLRRRHMQRLEDENAELDEQLRRIRGAK